MEYVLCNLETAVLDFQDLTALEDLIFSCVLNAISKTCLILWLSNLKIINLLK